MLGTSFASVADLAVLEGRTLVGIVPLEVLMAAPAGARVGTLMDPDPPVVAPDEDWESVAWAMVRKNESSVAVVDELGDLVGLCRRTGSCHRCLLDTTRTWPAWADISPAPNAPAKPPKRRWCAGYGTGCRGSWWGSAAPWRRRP